MQAYIEKGKIALVEKPKPTLIDPTDAIVRVTLGSICTSDLHSKHGSVPRPNAIVTVVALYGEGQMLPHPQMYGKNLTFKTGGVDGCDCEEVLELIAEGKIDTTALITHRFSLNQIEEAYHIFENKEDGVIKIAIYNV